MMVTSRSESNGSPPLCSTCRSLPLKALFTTKGPSQLDYGTPKELLSRGEHCAFCSLVKYALETHYGGDYLRAQLEQPRDPPFRLQLVQTPVDLSFFNSTAEISKVGRQGAFYVELHGLIRLTERRAREAGLEDRRRLAPKLQLLRDGGDDAASRRECALFGRKVEQDAIDWPCVTRWMRACEGRHAISRPGSGPGRVPKVAQDTGLQLLAIDVEQLCVLPLPPGARYMALSYMWGKDQKVKLRTANADAMATPGYLDTPDGRPSLTIVHAIQVSKHLGCRYLWVDALNIKQDDEANIVFNTGKMDQVYADAWVTIAAVAGTDADAGLPGVAPGVRRSRRQVRVQVADGVVLANMLEWDSEALNGTRWNTRGWTYQERLLSPRMLIFAEDQMHYKCQGGCNWREEMHMDEDGSAVLAPFDPRHQLDVEEADVFEVYAAAVAEYTKRAFSSLSDRLRGFQGVLNRLEAPFRGPFYQGIPASTFVDGLLWTPHADGGSHHRIPEFPSWSWAGWSGPVVYAANADSGLANLCETTISQVAIETTEGVRLSRVVDCPSWPSEGQSKVEEGDRDCWRRIFDEDSLCIHYALVEDGRPSPYLYPRPLGAFDKHQSDIIKRDKGGGVLRVRGKTAVFRLTKQHTRLLRRKSTTCDSGVHEICNIGVLDRRGFVAGTIFVHADLVPHLDGRDRRFVAVARSVRERTDYDPSWDPESRRFRPDTHPDSGRGQRENEYFRLDHVGGPVQWGEWCDMNHFNEFVFWPFFDILLLSEPGSDGTVQRLGIGKIHIDAFLPISIEESVLLS
ncbi:hypothetical protein MAPG_08959 [Magnaporthiopsis poae ATCC 64411]|uniref:Heterokaryon incompatibility domain-containing protein n=1 Tax=Magnaporthiopsis poae (strain ATCC 64411 / 73-15) TaxID=644358 RepID=A0A0C4E8P4_MAGP6|nr:hypothetical protein MAPG_08959 [Magnaporthiopsis poae ATCC 64411]